MQLSSVFECRFASLVNVFADMDIHFYTATYKDGLFVVLTGLGTEKQQHWAAILNTFSLCFSA